MNRSTRLPQACILSAAALITLSACAAGPSATQEPETPPAAPTTAVDQPTAPSAEPTTSAPSPQASTEEPVRAASGADMADHIHTLAYDGRKLLIGTHAGLWGQEPGLTPTQLSDEAFDVMGFTRGADRWLASGHPGEGMDAPSDLGLLQSTDDGRTWTEVSLSGEVDFHRLVTSDAVVVGVNAHDGRMLRSDDDGASWTDLGVPGLYDIAISPVDPATIVGTTEDGPVRSSDAGATFQLIEGAPLLALLAWTGDTLFGAGVDGTIHASTDDGATWSPRGSVATQPLALAASGTTLAALVGNRIMESTDGGATFAPRITELGGH